MSIKITKTMLHEAQQEHNKMILNMKIDNICEMVLKSARHGNKSFIYHITDQSVACQKEWSPYDYVPEIDELINGLIPRFENVFVRRVPEGILIDWS
jgi:hypothetical protein